MNGLFNLLKAPGPSSNDLVGDVKRALRKAGYPTKKVGHTGTLDPGAAGVLPISVGKATRLFDYLVDKEKEYRFELLFGIETDTLDTYGKIVSTNGKIVNREELLAVLPRFIGEQIQKPPLFSALKLGGRKLYEIARGERDEEEFESIRQKKARSVFIRSLELLEETGNNRFILQMRCSRGTYVRVICEDIAKALGTVGTMSFLLRSASGAFSIDDAISLDELERALADESYEKHLIHMDQALCDWPEIILPSHYHSKLKNGNAIDCNKFDIANDEQMRVYCRGEFFGIGKRSADEFRLICNLHEDV